MKRGLVTALAVCLMTAQLLGCAGAEGETESSRPERETTSVDSPQATLGRYVETEFSDENGSIRRPAQLLKKEQEVMIISLDGADARADAEAFAVIGGEDSAYPETLRQHFAAEDYITGMAAAENGARMYSIFRSEEEGDSQSFYYDKYFLTADGTEHAWDEAVAPDANVVFYDGRDGYFYVTDSWDSSSTRVYRVSAETGETEYLFEADGKAGWLFVCGDKIFLDMYDNLLIYSKESLQELEEDPVLNKTLADSLGDNNGSDGCGYLLYPGEDESIYVVTEEGVYRHVMYGSVMEQLIDGSLCSLSDISKLFVDMYVEESEGDMPVFYLLYDSGKLIRFVYDAQMPSVPDTVVTVYSLYEDNNIRMVISAYQKEHPETYVSYEVGVSGADGVTKEDALKNLATRLAAGEGPDIFLMDDLPYDSYVEKGILMDLNMLYERMQTEQDFFDNIVDAMREDEKLYTIPLSFYVPLLVGSGQTLGQIGSAEDMVAAMRDCEAPRGAAKAGLVDAAVVLQCMSYTYGQSFLREDGSLDRETLTDYLGLCKELYDADRQGMSEEDIQSRLSMQVSYFSMDNSSHYRNMYYMSRNMYSMAMCEMVFGDCFSIGNLGGNIRNGFNEFYALLQSTGQDYMLLPGEGKACIPSGMLSVNAATAVPEEAEEFLCYALTDFLYECDYLYGTPINRDALLKMEENTEKDAQGDPSYEPYLWYSFSSANDEIGEVISIEIAWCRPEVYERYNAMLDSVDSVSYCEYTVLDAVLEEGVAALTGESGIEETVDAIEKKVQLYLAE